MMATSPCRLPRLLGPSPEKLMDVSDVKMSDEEDFFESPIVTIKPNHTIVKERIWVNRVASEIVCQALHPGIGNQLHDEGVTAVREESDFHAVHICEGYALHHAILRSAGRDLSGYAMKNLTERRNSFTPSADKESARNVKEKLNYIGSDYDTQLKSTAEVDKEKTYVFPDRKHHLCRR